MYLIFMAVTLKTVLEQPEVSQFLINKLYCRVLSLTKLLFCCRIQSGDVSKCNKYVTLNSTHKLD